MSPTLVVFDLDGTLVDSRRDLAESANVVLKDAGAAPHTEEALGRMVGDGAATLVARAFAAAGCAQPEDALSRFLAVYNSRLLRHTRPYDGVQELLARLSRHRRLAVLTNKPIDATLQVLEGLGLASYFGDRVVGGDGPLPRKPDPAGLLHLMSAEDVSAEATLMVGDSSVDWHTARAAGVRACLVRYGFGFSGFPLERLSGDEILVDHPLDLLQRL